MSDGVVLKALKFIAVACGVVILLGADGGRTREADQVAIEEDDVTKAMQREEEAAEQEYVERLAEGRRRPMVEIGLIDDQPPVRVPRYVMICVYGDHPNGVEYGFVPLSGLVPGKGDLGDEAPGTPCVVFDLAVCSEADVMVYVAGESEVGTGR